MRRRFQKPRIRNKGGYWIAQFRDLQGRKRKVSLGPVALTKKTDAERKLARLLEPINSRLAEPTPDFRFGAFVRQVYYPFYRRKWKSSTTICNEGRVGLHLLKEFDARALASFSRDELQQYLDRKAADGQSYSVVGHLRWDLRQIFRMAVAEGHLMRNPAELLFIPREARRFPKMRLTLEQVRLVFSVLDLRERVMAGLAILAGLRPGEIHALRCGDLEEGRAQIRRRVYQGKIDTPKTFHSQRSAGLGDQLSRWLELWLTMLPDRNPEAWVFPSQTGLTPVRHDNCWKLHFLPRLKTVGLEWATFQVMRRTHATLLDDLGVDPQVRADQMGHTVDVNQNQYTRSSLERRKTAVNQLEKALGLS
jgi:integrase